MDLAYYKKWHYLKYCTSVIRYSMERGLRLRDDAEEPGPEKVWADPKESPVTEPSELAYGKFTPATSLRTTVRDIFEQAMRRREEAAKGVLLKDLRSQKEEELAKLKREMAEELRKKAAELRRKMAAADPTKEVAKEEKSEEEPKVDPKLKSKLDAVAIKLESQSKSNFDAAAIDFMQDLEKTIKAATDLHHNSDAAAIEFAQGLHLLLTKLKSELDAAAIKLEMQLKSDFDAAAIELTQHLEKTAKAASDLHHNRDAAAIEFAKAWSSEEELLKALRQQLEQAEEILPSGGSSDKKSLQKRAQDAVLEAARATWRQSDKLSSMLGRRRDFEAIDATAWAKKCPAVTKTQSDRYAEDVPSIHSNGGLDEAGVRSLLLR